MIDWFCGLGNFTLPLATPAREVLGIEGSEALVVQRARDNAERQRPGATHAASSARNLFEMSAGDLVADWRTPQRWLIDPPREGAFALAKALAELRASLRRRDWRPPRRIVYVSCNPATLARDAGLLVHQAGYRCSAAGVVNMFPHTAHVESRSRSSTAASEKGQGPAKRALVAIERSVRLVALAAEDAEQRQQALEHVVDVQVDRQRGRDVVGLAAVDDALQVVQHEGREDADGTSPAA